MTKPKLIFFDIDGTIIWSRDDQINVMPESAGAAMRALRKNGHKLIVCSGRCMRFIQLTFPGLFDGFIATNGTHVEYQGEVLYDRTLDLHTMKRLIHTADQLSMGIIFGAQQTGWPYHVEEKILNAFEAHFPDGPFLQRSWRLEEIRPNMLDVFYRQPADIEACRKLLGDEFVFNTHGDTLTADVSIRACDKATGVDLMIRRLGFNTADTIAIGDGYNDITMLERVGYGIAMGNAVPELKAKASYITDPIFSDGLSHAFAHLGLIETT